MREHAPCAGMPRCDCQPLLQAPRVAVAMLRACSWPSIICRCERVRSGPGGDTRASLFSCSHPTVSRRSPSPAPLASNEHSCQQVSADAPAPLPHARPGSSFMPVPRSQLRLPTRQISLKGRDLAQSSPQPRVRGERVRGRMAWRASSTRVRLRYTPPRGKIQGIRVRGRTARRQARC